MITFGKFRWACPTIIPLQLKEAAQWSELGAISLAPGNVQTTKNIIKTLKQVFTFGHQILLFHH